ncbi:MAG TPA: hypothetical protein VG889_21115 [Rhizomicrobium sp.]|nr:hypothetical protein [Rhizomicrobium sp.]
MRKRIAAALLCAAALASPAASGQTLGYAFKVKNATGGALAVTVDAETKCTLPAGDMCTVILSRAGRHAYAYSAAGAAPVSFAPGNLERLDLCRIDAAGAHCTDTRGAATN